MPKVNKYIKLRMVENRSTTRVLILQGQGVTTRQNVSTAPTDISGESSTVYAQGTAQQQQKLDKVYIKTHVHLLKTGTKIPMDLDTIKRNNNYMYSLEG